MIPIGFMYEPGHRKSSKITIEVIQGQVDMADEYKYDVFISYSHKDEDWVVNILLPALEKAGLKVCIDFRDFKAGKAAIFNMQDSAKESRHVVLNLTRNWLNSEWSLFEALIGATKDPAGLQQKIIPLLSEAGIEKDIHDFISMRSWVDFTRKDREQIAWKMLFTALGKPDATIPGTPAPEKAETFHDWHLAHPYPMPPNFTGRVAERKMLTDWLENDDENRLFILCALGGFGKSALAWHWLTRNVNAKQWPKVIWWSFYEGDASFEHFIEETLKYLKLEVLPGQRQQVDALLKAMQGQKILLIMDGFERALRAYSSMNAAYQGDEEQKEEDNKRDCVNINAEIFLKNLCVMPNIKGKVLMTTRLTPRAVEQRGELLSGCHEEELKAMQKEDAVAFFRAQGIRGSRAEIESACEPYGYHPLSLRVLAGLIANDRESPGDISVASKLDITEDVIQNKHHVLEVAYNTLSPEQQKLLSYIACFRSPVSYDALKAISDKDIDTDLKTLEHRGLLHWDKRTNKYDLHPIVRRYAYERLTAPDRTAAHMRMLDYFAAVDVPEEVGTLGDLAPVIELYHHMVRAGKFSEAAILFNLHIWKTLYYQLGGYQTQIELLTTLFPDGENKPPVVENDAAQTFFMNELANAYAVNGQPRRAIPLFEMHNFLEMKRESKNKQALIPGLTNLASMAQIQIGALKEAERNLRRAIRLCRKNQDELSSTVHQELGRLLSYRGAWTEAKQVLSISTEYWKRTNDAQGLCMDKEYRALRSLLMSRAFPQSQTENLKLAIQFATQAIDMADKDTRDRYYHPSDYIRAYWLLGAAYRKNNDLTKAEETLSKAISTCRQINLVAFEADILIELARLRYDQAEFDEVKSLAEEALLITERSGYVLQGADVHLFLAQYALEQEKDKEKAKEFAEKAKALAYCDGPPYCYKVAYEEAERLLKQLE